MTDLLDHAKAELALWDATSGVEISVLTGMTDAERAYRDAPETVRQLVAEVEKLRGAAKTLGKIIDDSLWDVATATDSLDLLDENRDGDWMLIFERLAELRPARDAALAEVERLRARETKLRELAANPETYSGTGIITVRPARILAVLDAEPTR